MCETLIPDVMAPEAHQNNHGYVCELSRHTFESLLNNYMEDLIKPTKMSKLDACTGIGICLGQYSMWVKSTHTKKNFLFWFCRNLVSFSGLLGVFETNGQPHCELFQWTTIHCILHEVWWAASPQLCHKSDCLNHDTVAVHLFQKQFIQYLKRQFSSLPRNIYYTSDGAASQYKNQKNFNLCQDFGVAAKGHFSATSHGKGTCDGVGGTVKRLASKASLQCPYCQQIMTPCQLFEWAVINIPAMSFHYLMTTRMSRSS